MIKVNLGRGTETRAKALPQKQKKKINIFKLLANSDRADLGGLLFLIAAVALAFLPTLFLDQYKLNIQKKYEAEKKRLEEKKSDVEQELKRFESYKAELEGFEKQKALLTQRLEALNALLRSRSGPVNIIDAVGQSVPEAAWLDKIALNLGENRALNISGSAPTSEAVTQLFEKLTSSIFLSDVRLNEMVNGLDGKETIKNFSFIADPKLN